MTAKKKTPKNPIRFKLSLSEEQKKVKEEVLSSKVSILTGNAGSSKTFLSVQIALDQLFTNQVDKVIVARPTVASEDIGYLPGSIDEKMAHWIVPIVHNMYALYYKEKIDKEFSEGNIEVLPLQFIGGVTFVNSIVVLDEAQNATHDQIERFVTRLGVDSKIIINGDQRQIDLKREKDSGLNKLIEISSRIDEISHLQLKENHRDPLVEKIIQEYNGK